MRALVHDIAIELHNRDFGIFMTDDPDERTIFTGEMPQDVNNGIYIIAVPSPPPHQYVDTEYTVLDFWVRDPHTDRGLQTMHDINELLHRRYDWSTDNWHIYFSQALGSIVDVDRDREGGKLLRLSVQFISRNLNHLS